MVAEVDHFDAHRARLPMRERSAIALESTRWRLNHLTQTQRRRLQAFAVSPFEVSPRLLTNAEHQTEQDHKSGADRHGTHAKLEPGSVVEPICINVPTSMPAMIAGIDGRCDSEEQNDRDPRPDKSSGRQV